MKGIRHLIYTSLKLGSYLNKGCKSCNIFSQCLLAELNVDFLLIVFVTLAIAKKNFPMVLEKISSSASKIAEVKSADSFTLVATLSMMIKSRMALNYEITYILVISP